MITRLNLFLCKYLYQKPYGGFVHDTDLNTCLHCCGLLSEFKDVLEDFHCSVMEK